jgi:GNAT superfamily N-acetyltransferase
MLLSGRGHVLGSDKGPPPTGVLLQPDTRLAVVVGELRETLIRRAGGVAKEILAAPDHAEWVTAALPDWTAESATLHVLPEFRCLPEPETGRVRLLDSSELSSIPDLPGPLLDELAVEAAAGSPIAAAFVDSRAVAFCYAGAVTETLWDVSIETLKPYRRRGFAAQCAAYLIRRLAEDGKRPVWGAAESNEPSARLAAKLGFKPVGSLTVFARPF